MSTDRTEEKEQERFWNEIRIGIFAVVALVLLVGGVRFLQGVSLFGDGYVLTANFETAEGVVEGTPVAVRGISVGRVEDVALGAADQGVRVRMRIQKDVQLTEGTTASVTGFSALDDVQISLQRSPGGDPLSAGAQIPTSSQNTIGQLRKRAVPIADRVDSVLTKAAGTFEEVQGVLGGSGTNMQRTVDNLRATSANIEALVDGEQDRMRSTIAHLERTSASLDTLVGDLQAVASGNRDTLAQAVQDAERTLHHTRRTARSLEESADDLEAILSGLREGEGTAGRLLNDPKLYDRTDTLTVRLNRILKDFEENPGRYVSLEIF